MSDFEVVIGLEVHVQLATKTKMFCNCSTIFGAPPNTQVCPVCMGMPGVLPVINERAVELAMRAALALHCAIATYTKFSRKNYFYPDLPKGYQISQYDLPFSSHGFLEVPMTDGPWTKVGITRAHLEEDAGKMVHGENGDTRSYIDLNRAGVPLLEIVSEPDIRSADEAYSYLKEIKSILKYLGTSDCNMEEGSLRCDANVSVRPKGSQKLGVKAEIKNLNSFAHVKWAIEYEARRQWDALQRGEKVRQATLMWVEKGKEKSGHEDEPASGKGFTCETRTKEYAHDYRYFPEPDLGPLQIAPEQIDRVRREMPDLPRERIARLVSQYGIAEGDASLLVQEREEADYFESCCQYFPDGKEIVNWIKGRVHKILNDQKISITAFPISAQRLAQLLLTIQQGKLTRNKAREIFDLMAASGQSMDEVLKQAAAETENVYHAEDLQSICQKVIERSPQIVESYRRNPNAVNRLLGMVMEETKGNAPAQQVKSILLALLGSEQ